MTPISANLSRRRPGSRIRVECLRAAACAAPVCASAAAYNWTARVHASSWPGEWPLSIGIQALTCWLVIAFFSREERSLRSSIDAFLAAFGSVLILQYGFAYLFNIHPLPWIVLLGGTLLATALAAAAVPTDAGPVRPPVFLAGMDEAARALAPALRGRIVGDLEGQPGCVIVGDAGREHAPSPAELLRLRYAGVVVEPASVMYERLFFRVNTAAHDAFEVLLSSEFRASRGTMALQAVFGNIAALSLVLALAPVFVAIAVAILLSSGGPVFESVECPGFQQIPFALLRFRTREANGERSRVGNWLARWGLADLPRLINVVRGEMTVVGPPPVRAEFSQSLSELLPLFGHRFTVRPGVFGWSQVNLRGAGLPDERLRLEYDLYYVKNGSPSMDLEILLRTIFRLAPAKPEVAPAVGTR